MSGSFRMFLLLLSLMHPFEGKSFFARQKKASNEICVFPIIDGNEAILLPLETVVGWCLQIHPLDSVRKLHVDRVIQFFALGLFLGAGARTGLRNGQHLGDRLLGAVPLLPREVVPLLQDIAGDVPRAGDGHLVLDQLAALGI